MRLFSGMNAAWRRLGALLLLAGTVAACNGPGTANTGNAGNEAADVTPAAVERPAEVAPRPDIYANFALTADLSGFSEQQRQMLVLLIEASNIMDDLFWRQAFRDDYADWLASIGVAETRRFAELNYGPWDRLDEEKPFMDGFGAKPLGANLYPADITAEEFEAAQLEGKRGLYSLIRRNEAGELTVVPYHVAFAAELGRAASLLRDAADLAEHEGFANYLRLRAEALVTDDYQPSDMAWLDVKTNPIELVIGSIETYRTGFSATRPPTSLTY